MVNNYEGNLVGKGLKFAIVISRFNEFLTNKLLSGAKDALTRHEVEEGDISVAWVPGANEIPVTALKMAGKGGFDAVICLGAVVRGATPHFDYVSSNVSRGIAKVSLQVKMPVIDGVVTADTLEQAIERSGTKMGNKGFDAAVSAIEMANLMKKLD